MAETMASIESLEREKRSDLRYMHRPPRIVPNYGKKTRSILPKSNVPRVLLYDNVTQQQMLNVKLSNLRLERQKAGRLLDLHRKSFLVRRMMRMQTLHQQQLQHQQQHQQQSHHHQQQQNQQQQQPIPVKVEEYVCPVVVQDGGEHYITEIPHDDTGHLKIAKDDSTGESVQIQKNAMTEIQLTTAEGVTEHGHVGDEAPELLKPHIHTSLSLPEIPNGGLVSLQSGGVGSSQEEFTSLHHRSEGGITQMLQTLAGTNAAMGKKRSGSRNALDTRFRRLERLLVDLDSPGNGYIELSPSYPKQVTTLPSRLLASSGR